MGFTKKDKVIFDTLFPKQSGESVGREVETIPPSEVKTYPGYIVVFDGEEYISDTYEELTQYITENFPANTYDIFYADEQGVRSFYASFTFQKPGNGAK